MKRLCSELQRQRAERAADERGMQAQRKLDQDKDVLLIEEELTKLDALDRARRKVGRSENDILLQKAVRACDDAIHLSAINVGPSA